MALRGDLHVALDVPLTRAQRAGAVRPGLQTSDLFALLKGGIGGLMDAPDDAWERLIAVVLDGLRAPR